MTVLMPPESAASIHTTPHEVREISDEDLKLRTRQLLKAAEETSVQLIIQTERLAAAIEIFQQEFIEPLRRELDKSDGTHGTGNP